MNPSDISSSILKRIESAAQYAHERANLIQEANDEFQRGVSALTDAMQQLPTLLVARGPSLGQPATLRVMACPSNEYVVVLQIGDCLSDLCRLELSSDDGKPAVRVTIHHNSGSAVRTTFRYHTVTRFLEAFSHCHDYLARRLSEDTTTDPTDPRLGPTTPPTANTETKTS